MSTQKTQEDAAVRTLLAREIRPTKNWHECLAQWEMAETLQQMESVLHFGFSASLERGEYGEKEYDRVDRYIFYFSIADGWADHHLLELPTDEDKEYVVGRDRNGNAIRKISSELRQQVAHKAFDMLCLNFFNLKTELLQAEFHRDELNEVWKLVVSERLFPIIQNFFKAEKETSGDDIRIRNLSRSERSHNEQQAVNFLLDLTRFMWRWQEPDIRYCGLNKDEIEERYGAMRTRIDAAKPWMVQVLSKLHRLDVLREWIRELDRACLAKLKEIALRNEFSEHLHPVIKSRLVATLDEACYLGSEAAWFLKEYDLKTREHKRLGTILEAKQQREEAAYKIKKLTTKKR